ncbi:hypothetical protein [Pseudomonas guariconensis]|nr:hypothetical protein [Pseudomonas guariconensis]
MNFEKMTRRNTERRSYDDHQALKARRGKRNKTTRGFREEWS